MIDKCGANLIFFLFIHLFYIIIECWLCALLLNVDYVPHTVFNIDDAAGNKTNKNITLNLHFSVKK